MAARVALVHDFLLDLRGAERVFAAICDAWPDADVFTAVYDERGTEGRFADRRPRTSFLQRVRPTVAHVPAAAAALPARDRVVRPARLRHRDLVLERVGARRARRPGRRRTSATATTRSATRGPSARRRCARATRSSRPALRLLLNRWRQWDWIAAQRVDRYVANSHLTAARIGRYFGRESTVLYPPVETGRFEPGARVGDALHGAGRADGAQADRRRGPRLQRARAAAPRRRRRARGAAAAAPRRPDDHVHRPASATSASPTCSRGRARSS